jgi:hypothetical protein
VLPATPVGAGLVGLSRRSGVTGLFRSASEMRRISRTIEVFLWSVFLTLCAYVATYYLCVQQFTPVSVSLPDNYTYTASPFYRIFNHQFSHYSLVAKFFRPIHLIDVRLRDHYWVKHHENPNRQ